MLSIISIIGKNREIGCENRLLWDIPEDMRRFRQLTTGHPVIMGRKTFESISQPLPHRFNIVISRDGHYRAEKIHLVSSLADAISLAKNQNGSDEIFIIGGGQIYAQAMGQVDKLYLTIVDDAPQADTFFPDYSGFKTIVSETKSGNGQISYTFLDLIR